jgi:hypothetical protein
VALVVQVVAVLAQPEHQEAELAVQVTQAAAVAALLTAVLQLALAVQVS